MSADTKLEFAKFKEKLDRLEQHLQHMLASTERDVETASYLQKILHQNRLPEVQGVECLARYISAQQISSEGFDLISTRRGREVWMIFSWTESFGLSSILLQSMVHLQSKALVETKSDLSPSDIFNDLSMSLAGAKRSGHYRLLVAKLDTAHLKISGCGIGFAPFITRKAEKNQFGPFEFCQEEAFQSDPALLNAAQSATPTLAEQSYHFHFSLPPGSRLYFLSSAFAQPKDLATLKKIIGTAPVQAQKVDSSLVEDLNYLLMRGEDHMKETGKASDLTAMALEVDARKLHLA